ncbi:MAG TPA: TRAP transporter small permease subunit [Thioalkalivibrio sp.]|nr:TRAP transporter small permease subunit [Thioalkalivibrio sp.]
MDAVLARFAAVIDTLNDWVGRAVAWLTLAMVLLMFAMVVLRYGFDWNSIALQESVTYLHALIFMAGVAYTLRHDEHVRVDIFYRQMTPRRRALVNLLGALLLLVPVCLFILVESWDYVARSWRILEGSRQTGGLPLTFLLKSFIPLMAGLLLLQGLAQAAHALRVLRGRETPPPADGVEDVL